MKLAKYSPKDILALAISIRRTSMRIEDYIKNKGINIKINNTIRLQNNSGLILSQFDSFDYSIYIYNQAILEFLKVTNKKPVLMPGIYESCLAHELFHYLEYMGELKTSQETNTLSSEMAAEYFSGLVTGLNLSEQ
jgi:Zn-dependent peptidase ImmA (M78 family)